MEEKNNNYNEINNILSEVLKDNEISEIKKEELKTFLTQFFNNIDVKRRSITNLSIDMQFFYTEVKNKTVCTKLFDDLNQDISYLEDVIKISKCSNDIIKTINEFKEMLNESIRQFTRGILRNYFTEDEVEENLNRLINIESLKGIIDSIYELCHNKYLNESNKKSELDLFKTKLEENYEHNSEEYRNGINSYFQLKNCSPEEFDKLYEEKNNELFGKKIK